jgi:hypothetical protein
MIGDEGGEMRERVDEVEEGSGGAQRRDAADEDGGSAGRRGDLVGECRGQGDGVIDSGWLCDFGVK